MVAKALSSRCLSWKETLKNAYMIASFGGNKSEPISPFNLFIRYFQIYLFYLMVRYIRKPDLLFSTMTFN